MQEREESVCARRVTRVSRAREGNVLTRESKATCLYAGVQILSTHTGNSALSDNLLAALFLSLANPSRLPPLSPSERS